MDLFDEVIHLIFLGSIIIIFNLCAIGVIVHRLFSAKNDSRNKYFLAYCIFNLLLIGFIFYAEANSSLVSGSMMHDFFLDASVPILNISFFSIVPFVLIWAVTGSSDKGTK